MVEGHRAVVIQGTGLNHSANVLVCPISSKRDPSVHVRERARTLGDCDEQPPVTERDCYFHVHRLGSVKRTVLKPDKLLGLLNARNMASLELALIRVLGLPAVMPSEPPS